MMLDKDVIKALQKVYQKEKDYDYDFEKDVSIYNIPSTIKEKEWQPIIESGFNINEIVYFSHNGVVEKFAILKQQQQLEKIVCNLFLQAIGKGFHRGIQPIFSYYFIKNLPSHNYLKYDNINCDFNDENPCTICGIKDEWHNKSETVFHLYIGYPRLYGTAELIFDLEEVLSFTEVKADKHDVEIFYRLLDCIENAHDDETASELIKRIAKEKILPKSNNTSRTWLIRCLASLGVIKNAIVDDFSIMSKHYSYQEIFAWEEELHKRMPARSDPVFPVSAWCGRLGVNRELAKQIVKTAELKM